MHLDGEEEEDVGERLLFHSAYGEDDPEKATVPYIAASVAAASGHDAVVVCTAEAVWTGTAEGVGRVAHEGMPTVSELSDQLVEAGGEVWLCSACTRPRGITEDVLAPGARIVGAALIVDAIATGARSVTLT